MKKIATHSGTFHADDIFAVATLGLLLEEVDVVRTREDEKIAEADYVVDVGGDYDPERNRFDHHQSGGAGERTDDEMGRGIPYASFGLVWKHFGEEVCDSAEIAQVIDQRLVQPVDALDNGVEISEELFEGLRNYSLHSIVSVFRPTWREVQEETADRMKTFKQLVDWAQVLLEREIQVARDNLDGEKLVVEAYEKATDKRLVELSASLPWGILSEYPEPLFVVYPKDDGTWSLKCVKAGIDTFENRLDLPESWAGKRGIELQAITGVDDAVFAHNGRFMAVASSRDGILQLAQKALSENI